MTHAHQVGLREERINLIHSQIRRKATKKVEVLRSKIEENKIVEEKLSRFMVDKPFTEVEHEHFAKLLSNELKTFVLARRGDLLVSKLPNKGKIADAIRGDKNLISLAFSCRVASVILHSKLKEAEESEGNIGSVTEDDRDTFFGTKLLFALKTSRLRHLLT